jgi:hypothetical protein
MEIAAGSRVGAIERWPEPHTTAVHMGRIAEVGPLRAIPVWLEPGGLRLLVLMPLRLSPLTVKKGGARQAGAFLLEPGESFGLGGTPAGEVGFRFNPSWTLEAMVEPGELCTFCRTPLEEGGVICLGPALEKALRGRVLCPDCAAAWGEFPEADSSPGARDAQAGR